RRADLPELRPVAIVGVERRDREGQRADLDPEDPGDDLLEDGPLEGVDPGPTPHQIVRADEDARVELAEAALEGDDVVTGDVLPRAFVLPASVHQRVPDPEDGAAARRVRAEFADDRVELIDGDRRADRVAEHPAAEVAEPGPVSAAPRLAVVRELDRAGEVV